MVLLTPQLLAMRYSRPVDVYSDPVWLCRAVAAAVPSECGDVERLARCADNSRTALLPRSSPLEACYFETSVLQERL